MNFFHEALCVASAITVLAGQVRLGGHLVLYTDNENTVHMYSSLAARPEYNPLLKHSVDIILHHQLQFKVIHIPGERNVIADALSWNWIPKAKALSPGLLVSNFEPPRDTLGALQK